ncbi:hypothetical protein K432DRAFT_396917 [Lepidopterella palustris CBS 459.81]|uniref:Uncharacterized protein n=1 Tax=Lepidopterella palustris CBS 459.81 TaxID=1314670 RepID=A0A8E2E1W4_9PEZI|nr:hypothetical protein K432DRAFT_396917 [Lepidopterella palustris CBS 459.81]
MKQSVPGRKRSVNMGLSLYQQKPPQNSMQIYTVITPSPGASHVQGTQQSQMVTVFTPQMTIEFGCSLQTPSPTMNNTFITPAPTIKEMVTYYMAPWQSLTQGNTPSDIESKICTTVDDGSLECVQYQAAWQVQVATSTSKMTSHVDLVTTPLDVDTFGMRDRDRNGEQGHEGRTCVGLSRVHRPYGLRDKDVGICFE